MNTPKENYKILAYQNNLIKWISERYKGELKSELISIVLKPKTFILVDGEWIEEPDNVSPQKLSTKTKDRLKTAITKSELYDTIYFYYDELDEGTVKKELDDLLNSIIEIVETDGVNDGN